MLCIPIYLTSTWSGGRNVREKEGSRGLNVLHSTGEAVAAPETSSLVSAESIRKLFRGGKRQKIERAGPSPGCNFLLLRFACSPSVYTVRVWGGERSGVTAWFSAPGGKSSEVRPRISDRGMHGAPSKMRCNGVTNAKTIGSQKSNGLLR